MVGMNSTLLESEGKMNSQLEGFGTCEINEWYEIIQKEKCKIFCSLVLENMKANFVSSTVTRDMLPHLFSLRIPTKLTICTEVCRNFHKLVITNQLKADILDILRIKMLR